VPTQSTPGGRALNPPRLHAVIGGG
jgi:hypothetical protein